MTILILLAGIVLAAITQNVWVAVGTIALVQLFLWLRLNFLESIVYPQRKVNYAEDDR